MAEERTYKELQEYAKQLGLGVIVGTPKVDLIKAIEAHKSAEAKSSSKSAMIRTLHDSGMEVKDIAKQMGINYAFVYGVVERHTVTKPKTKKATVSDEIRKLHDQGMDRADIKRTLSLDYAFVHTVVKNYELKKSKQQGSNTVESEPTV